MYACMYTKLCGEGRTLNKPAESKQSRCEQALRRQTLKESRMYALHALAGIHICMYVCIPSSAGEGRTLNQTAESNSLAVNETARQHNIQFRSDDYPAGLSQCKAVIRHLEQQLSASSITVRGSKFVTWSSSQRFVDHSARQ